MLRLNQQNDLLENGNLDSEVDFKPTYKRKQNPKKCRCFICHKEGHLANNCPKMFNKNLKIFEIDEDMEKMIDEGEFIQINDLHDIDSDESIFILTETEYTSSENE